jgi:3-phenylpropionate/trans-cinnamate dioxygenase ferredoxin reductase subunit
VSRRTLAIVGASLAGAEAAEGAREAGFDGRIVLIGDEPTPPYERPPLSKAVLRGEDEPESARVHPEGFYRDHDIELVTDQVVALEVDPGRLELRGGPIDFDSAVLATGARPRRLAVPGADLAGVHHLRTLDDAVRLRDAVRSAARVAVIGAGWIGSEVAASARQMGTPVVLVDPAPVPLQRVLGDEIGAMFRGLHADHGVDLRLGRGLASLRGDGTVEELVLDDGTVEAADAVVVGIGVVPVVELAEPVIGLRVDDGIVVDQHLETSVPGIYAAGDVANAWHPHYRRHLRVEHWANAQNQGATAGRNATGDAVVYDRLPYFFSDQYDLGMEYVGHASPGDEVVVRGDLAKRELIAFWHRDGVVSAAMNVNVWDVVDDLKAIVTSGKPVDPGRLADPDIALTDLA